MSDLEYEQQVPVQQVVSGEAEAPSSTLESLRRKREALTENRTVDLAVPGYDKEPPALYIRYNLLQGPEIDRITRKVMRETKDRWDRQVLSSIDAMIAACEGLYIDWDDGTGRQPLTLNGDHILNFGPELAQALGIQDAGSARAIVREVFGNNDVALAQHNIQLSRWMGNTASEVDEELLGNL